MIAADNPGNGSYDPADPQAIWLRNVAMSAPLKELESFSRFASQRLSHGDQIPSLEECLRQWRAECERDELLADLEASQEDVAQGRMKPVEQAFADVRRRLGWLP